MAIGTHKNWMDARCAKGDKYYFYLKKWELMLNNMCKELNSTSKFTHIRTFICGPQWREFCVGYGIEVDDIVKFTYDEKDHVFNIEVTNASNATKPFVQASGMLVCVIFLTH